MQCFHPRPYADVRTLRETSDKEREAKDPLGHLPTWTKSSSFGNSLWVFPFPDIPIWIKTISEACLALLWSTWAILELRCIYPTHLPNVATNPGMPDTTRWLITPLMVTAVFLEPEVPHLLLSVSISWWGKYRQQYWCPLYRQENPGQKRVRWLSLGIQIGSGGVTPEWRRSEPLFN